MDAVNLAEDYFVNEDFENAAKYAKISLEHDINAPVSARLGAHLYLLASEYLLQNKPDAEEMFRKMVGKLSGFLEL